MTPRCRPTPFRLALGTWLIVLAIEAGLGFYLWTVPADGLGMRRLYTRVVETTGDPTIFNSGIPGHQVNMAENDVAFLRVWIQPALARGHDDASRVAALRELVHHALPIGPEVGSAIDPVPAFVQAMSLGRKPTTALCGTFARLLVAAARVAGFDARLLHIRPAVAGAGTPWPDPDTGHYTTEVFLPSEGRWVVMDAFYNAHFRIGGQTSGALDLHQALRDGKTPGGTVEVVQGRTQDPQMDAHILLPYFGRLSVRGEAAFQSGVDMLLRQPPRLILTWAGQGDSSLRAWDATVLRIFILLGLGLTVAIVVLIARPRPGQRR
jgi:hypothetical protein